MFSLLGDVLMEVISDPIVILQIFSDYLSYRMCSARFARAQEKDLLCSLNINKVTGRF